jgi:hypothetical protein
MSPSPELKQRWREMSRVGRAAVTTAAASVVVPVVLLVALFTLPAVGSVSAEALTYSLTREAGGDMLSTDLYTCEPRSEPTYRCQVGETNGASGGFTYRLRTRGRRCWSAVRTPPSSDDALTSLPRRLTGCAKWRDQVRLVERALP